MGSYAVLYTDLGESSRQWKKWRAAAGLCGLAGLTSQEDERVEGRNWTFDITFLFGLQYLGVRVSLAPVIFASLAPVAT